MPVVKQTLPDGSVKVLTGGAAEAFLAAQKKADKEAKKALEKKKVEALKSGDASAVAAAKAELSSSNAAARMSGAEEAHAEVLNEIRAGSSEFQFYRVMAADWESDEELIASYQKHNLGFDKAEDAPGRGKIHLFVGVQCLSDEKIKEMYEAERGRRESLEWFTAHVKKPKVFEMHPSLLKKNGKMAVDIPEGAMVAVKSENNTAQRLASVSGAPGSRITKLTNVNITHKYICAVIPPEMEASCIV